MQKSHGYIDGNFYLDYALCRKQLLYVSMGQALWQKNKSANIKIQFLFTHDIPSHLKL